jgi:hypothetical protein
MEENPIRIIPGGIHSQAVNPMTGALNIDRRTAINCKADRYEASVPIHDETVL